MIRSAPAAWKKSATILRRYGLAAPRFAVLASVAIPRANSCNPFGGAAFGGVDHDPLLHQEVVHRSTVAGEWVCRMNTSAPRDGLAEAGPDFPVGEVDELAGANFDTPRWPAMSAPAPGATARSRAKPMLRDQFHLATSPSRL